jgi:hypothetical protein
MTRLILVGLIAAALLVFIVVAVPALPGGKMAILFNDKGNLVMAGVDTEALHTAISFVQTGDGQAQMKADEVEGRLFYITNGSRAQILERGEQLIGDIKAFKVSILTGSGAGRTAFVTSSVVTAIGQN